MRFLTGGDKDTARVNSAIRTIRKRKMYLGSA